MLDKKGELPTVCVRHKKPKNAINKFDVTATVFLLKRGTYLTKL